MEERANFWPISMSTVKKEDVKLFYEYLVFLFTR